MDTIALKGGTTTSYKCIGSFGTNLFSSAYKYGVKWQLHVACKLGLLLTYHHN
jgi:hypothetical protein